MITEYDAKNKWCPFARLSEMGGTYNRTGPAANLECIGSQCMAWRAVETPEFKTRADTHFKKTGGRLVADAGFCGLAGQPTA